MLPSEIEESVNELETRVDRLRALYEQYFMGIEKMEPHVARKDVDRRVQQLRREQIRNTALRFRFHMILQRYNTYQTYWIRICREIEEGTYKRHLVRATQKFGDVAERALPKWHRKRFWKKDGEAGADASANGDANANANANGANQLGDFDDSELDAAFDSVVMPAPAPAPPRRSSVPAAPRPRAAPPPLPARARAGSAPSASEIAAPKPSRPAPAAATSERTIPAAAAAAGGPAADATKEERMRELARRLSEKKAAAAAAAQASAATPSGGSPARPSAAEPSQPQHQPQTSAPNLRPGPYANRPSPPRPAAPAPAAAAPKAAPAPPPAPAPAPAARPAGPPASARDLSEERMRQLYSELVETKRRQKESTAAVTYEAMVKTLRESSAKLKEKHGGRSVDFEVTVKDGKTILRPVVK